MSLHSTERKGDRNSCGGGWWLYKGTRVRMWWQKQKHSGTRSRVSVFDCVSQLLFFITVLSSCMLLLYYLTPKPVCYKTHFQLYPRVLYMKTCSLLYAMSDFTLLQACFMVIALLVHVSQLVIISHYQQHSRAHTRYLWHTGDEPTNGW